MRLAASLADAASSAATSKTLVFLIFGTDHIHTCLHCVSPANTAPSTTTRNATARLVLAFVGRYRGCNHHHHKKCNGQAHALLMCLGKSWTRSGLQRLQPTPSH